ncbi:MAG TPA: FAD-dependent oxidoreductase [Longimicrobium sp.]|nr:FAD-dependent oxidoreductase [Longimicrobium sp.]
MRIEASEFLVLGAGVAGLAAAAELGPRARVLERDGRPGGLVRTECFGGYWFDRVLHLLHFQDAGLRAFCQELLGGVLAPCPPEAWVETQAGTARFPLQFHLAGLEPETRRRCLQGVLAAAAAPEPGTDHRPAYDEYLARSFGEPLCELFYHPYNRKQWKRPLGELVPGGQTWNLQRPSADDALCGARGIVNPSRSYNADGFYPRPPRDAPVRGMEVLARALAARAADLRLGCAVVEVDPGRQTVFAVEKGERVAYRYERACLCTLPLPHAIAASADAPDDLRRAAAGLQHNAVLSAAFCVRGPRPEGTGLWRYYADESLCFTRLIFMTEFDPLNAPPDGWGLLAEIPVRPGEPRPPDTEILATARRDAGRAGVLGPDAEVIDARLMVADPAYVVFTRGSEETAAACRAHLARGRIAALGRYGRWEYSSMAQALGQGLRWARTVSAGDPWAEGDA